MKLIPSLAIATLTAAVATACTPHPSEVEGGASEAEATTEAIAEVKVEHDAKTVDAEDSHPDLSADSGIISIGSGSITGLYYPTAGAICGAVNHQDKLHCMVEASGGSYENVKLINSGKLEFALGQGDVAFKAYNGTGKFKGDAHPDLRSVMAIYPELLSLVVREDANISSVTDLAGKKANIGTKGSGVQITSDEVLTMNGLSTADLGEVFEKEISLAPSMLQAREIDGYFAVFGHPSDNITQAANMVDINLVPISGSGIDRLVDEFPYFTKGVIHEGTYKGVNKDVDTIGVKAILLTNANVADEVVELITSNVLANFDEFKNSHPAYNDITKESLLQGLGVPQHPAAKEAFSKAGIK